VFDLSESKELRDAARIAPIIRISDGEIDSRELFQTAREIRIRHDGNVYRLRLTSLNKLILTK
jgi:hemin uptake protein HemP